MTKEKLLQSFESACVKSEYEVIGIVFHKNGCCCDEPILITTNPIPVSDNRPDGLNYSCQCACGRWVTSGNSTPSEALAEYEDMTRRKESKIKA